jgi:hypothetical protein
MMLPGDPAGDVANDGHRLEDRIHILGGQSRREGQHHDRSAKKANFPGDSLAAELIRQRLQRGENLFSLQA